MTAKNEIISTTLNPLHQKFSSNDHFGKQTQNPPFKKSTGLLSSLSTNKTGTFIHNDSHQDSSPYNNAYTSISHSALLNGAHKKSPVQSLVIDTNNETSKYNTQSSLIGSYTTTHNNSNSYNFGKGTLASLNGNLTTKFGRGNETYKSSFIPSTKNASTTRLLLGPTTSYPYTNPNQALKDSTSTVLNTMNEHLSPANNTAPLSFKNNSTKNYLGESNKPGQFESHHYDGKLSSNTQPKNPQVSNQQENIPLNEQGSSSGNNRNDTKNPKQGHADSSHSDNMASKSQHNNHSHNNNSNQIATLKKLHAPIPNHEPTKCSVKRNGIVKAYAANTNQGIVRNYNEDRVSIILNIMKPASRVNEDWPKCSFFGVYDGHGGVNCADFLRDNLHQYVIKEPSFPWNPKEALLKGFEAAEKAFIELAQNQSGNEVDRSGSCAIVVLIIGDMCYVANVGDSRAVMSGEGGNKIFPLSRDHKPSDENEQKRIVEAGGKIYQTQAPALRQAPDGNNSKPQMQFLLGPHRVFPGRLSVSRTFGDIEAKLTKLGGNPNVVIAVPEIKAFKIASEHDFIVLASDGIYDKLSSRDVVKSVWESTQELSNNIHHQCGLAVENILREAISRRTLDNITVVMICFKNFKYKLFPRDKTKKVAEENYNRKDSEQISNRNVLGSKSNPGHNTLRSISHNPKDKLADQENIYDVNNVAKHHSRKNAAPLLESSIPNVAEAKKYNTEKGDFSQIDTMNKKRGGSSVGLSCDTQKLESMNKFLSPNNATGRSVDYKNGEGFKFRNYVDK